MRSIKIIPNFLILSHTVDPEHDSVSVLKAYAAKHGADSKNWWFLTGDKKQLYRLARQGYLVDDGVYTGEEDFVHPMVRVGRQSRTDPRFV